MANISSTSDRATEWKRWTARGLGSLAGAYWAVALVAEAIWGDTPASLEGAVLGVLVGATVLGVALAWRWEGLGGMIVVVGAIALGIFAYFTAGRNRPLAISVTGGPFLVAGVLFLASWRRASGPRGG